MAEDLIKAVEQYPELYDRAHPLHKNADRKLEIWDTIGASMSTTGTEASKRWKDIRDSFVKSRRRGLPPRNPNKVYKPYRHAALLDFLLPCLLGPNKVKRTANSSLENGGGVVTLLTDEMIKEEKKPTPKKTLPDSMNQSIDMKDKNVSKEEQTSEQLDEDDLFFRSMACSCKKLPPNVKSFVRFKIHEIIFQAENQIIAVSEITPPTIPPN